MDTCSIPGRKCVIPFRRVRLKFWKFLELYVCPRAWYNAQIYLFLKKIYIFLATYKACFSETNVSDRNQPNIYIFGL